MDERPTKILITPFTDKELTNQDRSVDPYSVPVNPEQYSLNYKINTMLSQPVVHMGYKSAFWPVLPKNLN
ncbi:MAG: hypothetical protein HC896_05120 [Bacteroidales bacterium]|nr:hypothetical protein [Bacteroidales bacterium]